MFSLRSISTHSNVSIFLVLFDVAATTMGYLLFLVMGICVLNNECLESLFCILMLVLVSMFVSFKHANFFPY